MEVSHAGGCIEGCSNLVEVSRSDTGAGGGFGEPAFAGSEDFGPEGVGAALFWFDGMDGAAGGGEEVAIAAARGTEAEGAASAVHEAGFKLGGGEREGGCDTVEIGFSEIDEALFVATSDAAGLTLKAEGGAQIGNRMICFGCIRQGLRFILNNVDPSKQREPKGTKGRPRCRNVRKANSSSR